MNDASLNEPSAFQEIHILTFTVMGIRMGIDIEQVSEMMYPREAAVREIEVIPLHERLPLGKDPVTYRSPTVLLLRDRTSDTGIMIDQPGEIIPVAVASLRVLPAVLERCIHPKAIWGVALIGEEMILLTDLYRFTASAEAWTERSTPRR